MADIVDIITDRIGDEFDGECHLTYAEASQAAAEIVRLRNEVEYLKLEMDGVENGKMELAKLLGCEDEPRWKWLRLGIRKALDRCAALEKALEPFAQVADMEEAAGPNDSVMVNVARCRDARSIIQQKEG